MNKKLILDNKADNFSDILREIRNGKKQRKRVEGKRKMKEKVSEKGKKEKMGCVLEELNKERKSLI